MNENRRNLTYVTWGVLCAIVCVVDARSADAAKPITVVVDADASARVRFGVERLSAAMRGCGLEPTAGRADDRPAIIVGTHGRSAAVGKLVAAGSLHLPKPLPGKEGFVLRSIDERRTVVVGMDDSGTLYGCLELAERIRKAGGLPGKLDVADSPRFVLRGPCIGMQKMRITYDGMIYDYPYTPENFPFFYDKQQWRQYLDFLVSQRMNMLVLWNGHPFPSLLKLPKYPEAQEVSDEVLKRNIEVFTWLTEEADRRGIWVIQFFYNIHISHPLAKKHNIPFQHGRPTKLTSDYTRYCISEFVRSYPHVGLAVCLGEALQGHQNKIDWFTKVILPGVTDGMKQLGITEEPPVILRAHSIPSPKADVLTAGLKVYKNLYTMAKLNGEALTTWQPRGRWRKIHQDLSSLGSTHVVNVHLLSNLEPFRYGSPSFVQKCMLASRDTLGARALHLYPLNYWDWPYSPDNTQPRLKQIDRDWMWFATWARYAWNPDRNPAAEREYWTGRLAERYGSREAGEGILDAYEGAGECAPRILRRFGITGGGRQTMSLGMLMTQLVNPDRYHPWVDLWQSDSPPGERLGEYVDREWNRRPHEGETPPRIIDEILRFSEQAVTAIDAAAPHVTKNRDEFERLRNDVRCIRAMTCCYAAKARAAMLVLRYGHGGELADLKKALPLLEESLDEYRKLTALTKDAYLYSNSLQTAVRRIPLVGADGRNSHWLDLLPVYEKELSNFRGNLARLRAKRPRPSIAPDQSAIKPWPAASFKLLGKGAETYPVRPGAKVFTDRDYAIRNLAGELKDLVGVRFSHGAAKRERMKVDFEVSEPVKVLVGYFDDRRKTWLQVPDLEVQADADDRGGYDPVLRDAVVVPGLPPVNVHAFSFGPGRHVLDPGKGSYLVLGVVKQSAKIKIRNASLGGGRRDKRKGLDWLFESGGSTAAPKTSGEQREFACTAPSTPEEVAAAVKRLREACAPYLRSLPRPLEVRTRMAVGNEWRFKFEMAQAKEGTEKPRPPEWFREDFDDSSWDKATVPEWRYIAKKPQSHRRPVSCISWYRTRFSAAPPKPPRRAFLVFGGVDWEAEVWLNGKFLGGHKVYCEPFRFDVTSLLKETNTLAVRVIDGPVFGEPHAYWSIFPDSPAGDNQRYVPDRSRSVRGYQKSSIHIGNGFGIFREVYLETTGEICVSEIFARGDLKKQCVDMKVEMDATAADDVVVEVQVLPENFEGRRYRKTVSCRVPKGPSTQALSVPMLEAKLWSPQSPRLYRCRVIVRRDKQVIDAKDVLFGYRSFSIVSRKNPYPGLPDGMFLLNGRPIFLRGTSIQGLNLLSYWNERDKLVDCILMLKAANFNAVRVCQHVSFPEVRELFDRLGIMSEQDQGGGRNRDRKKALVELAHAGRALARVCYNNPGVVLLSFANETKMEPRGIIDAVLVVDDERIVKPTSGNHNESPRRYDLPDSYWSNVIDDFHTYIGWFNEWYGPPWEGQIWGFNQKYEGRRAVTVGEYGAHGLDAYETMRDHYPAQFGPPPPLEADALWGHTQIRKADKRQIAGFGGKRPSNLGEYIEASQNYQATLLAEITKGFRLSPRRISGYFQFYSINVLAANLKSSIVSHDLRPKKGYFAMARVNQPLVPLFRITDRGARMEVWAANDLPKGLKDCKVRWRVAAGETTFVDGQKSVAVAASNAVLVEKVDLSAVPREVAHVTVSLVLLSPTGDTLSRYEQKVFLNAWRLEDAIFE